MPIADALARWRPWKRGAGARPDAVGALAANEAVWLAHVERRAGGAARLLAHAHDSAPGGDPAAALCRQPALRRAPLHLLMPNASYQFLQLDAPAVPRTEWVAATRWQLKDFIDFDPNEAQLDCVAIPRDDGTPGNRLFAAVTRQQTVRQLMLDHRRAGLNLQSLDVPEMALRNLLTLTGDGPAQALVHVGHTACWIVLLWNAELVTTRRIEVGLKQLAAADAEDRFATVERLALEFQRTSDAFARAYTHGALQTLWLSAGEQSTELATDLGNMLTLAVRAFALDEHLAGAEQAPRDPDFLLACGAALRPRPERT